MERRDILKNIFVAIGIVSVNSCAPLPKNCTSLINGISNFIGDVKCLSSLPKKTINGYWVVDHEYSVFYFDRETIKNGYDDKAYWLELSPNFMKKNLKYIRVNKRTIYEVKFVGSESSKVGVYGNGTFKKGMLMDKIIYIK